MAASQRDMVKSLKAELARAAKASESAARAAEAAAKAADASAKQRSAEERAALTKLVKEVRRCGTIHAKDSIHHTQFNTTTQHTKADK